jgi:hypothetical protein
LRSGKSTAPATTIGSKSAAAAKIRLLIIRFPLTDRLTNCTSQRHRPTPLFLFLGRKP